ncbi:Mannosyl-D-glycerate transport/metabolism system repressor MngR [Streptomyces sp. YIM 130001]|uniref:GntR family transcriptional regulator n=1 Tax=Streptomyces sp. YIM 130001 TaxID=2259644 RepID=UPI000E6598C6|nr:GntR family transcriptional regulator [Streptomyces sp. YIM 130001]RII13865.1 Mannosyl-D-glycerate transport/metabolism system repressor MngR [Streptomyces sp. YIM 130001]
MSKGRAGDGGGKEFQRVSDALRSRLADGTYRVGARLPGQRELADEFGVSRDTVQRVLRDMADEGWIESRQGSGSRVVKGQRIQSPPAQRSGKAGRVTLGSLVAEAFAQPEVTLDVFTLTSESLDAHVRIQAENIRSGAVAAPERISVRMLLPAQTLRLPYPRPLHDRDDLRLQERLHTISRRYLAALRDALDNLQAQGFVPTVRMEVRRVELAPTFKVYLFNGVEALQGPYEVVERPIRLDSGEQIEALDVLGVGSTLTHYVTDDDPQSEGSVFVRSTQAWFESLWRFVSVQEDADRPPPSVQLG